MCAFAESKTSDLACASRVPAWPSGPFGRDDEVFLLYLSRSFTSLRTPRCSRKPPALWGAPARLPCCRRFSSRNSVIWDCRWGSFRCPVVAPSGDVLANKSPRGEGFRSGSRSRSFTSSGSRSRSGSRFGSRSRSRSCTGSRSRSGSLRSPHAVSLSWTLHSSRGCCSLLADVALFS